MEPFLKATSYVTALGWSFCLAVICLAHPIIRVLYGDQWDQSVDLARLLAIAIALNVPIALCSTALLSSGAVNIIARSIVLGSIQSMIFAVIGASQGLMALGLAIIVSTAITSVIWLRATIKHIGLPLPRLLHTLRQSGSVALMTGVGPAVSFWIYGPYPDAFVMPLLLGGAGGLIGFILGSYLFQHPLREEIIQIWSKVVHKSV